MRPTNSAEVVVTSPTKGLDTSVPSRSPDKRAIVVAQNVRAEFGVLRNAPGFEGIQMDPGQLDSAANLIYQSNILSNDPETRSMPIIGTGGKLYTVRRRASELTCATDGSGGSNSCPLNCWILGDSDPGDDLLAVSNLIKNDRPDIIIHTGDIVYSGSDYEASIGQYFFEYIGGYNGIYGTGPTVNKLFPVPGNHDHTDIGIEFYEEFFQLPKTPTERYYHFKRGPVHFIHLDGYEDADTASEQAEWAREVVAESDCPWVFVVVHYPTSTSDSSYYPGIANLAWIQDLNITGILSGHAHNLEFIRFDTGVVQVISGAGGHSHRGFVASPVTGSLFRNATDYGAVKMEATKTTLTFTFFNVDGDELFSFPLDTPLRTLDTCYIGSASRELQALEVRPEFARVEVGFTWPFSAFAHYTDGSVEDVTLQALWESADEAIATVGANSGQTLGVSPGSTNITATFGGLSDYGTITVLHTCLDEPMEICFVLERSESMGTSSGGRSRMEAVKEGVNLCMDGFDSSRGDKIGLVSFAGTYATQTEESTLDSVLSGDFPTVEGLVSSLIVGGTGSSLADALSKAKAEITSARHVTGQKRAVIIVVDGPADVVSPGGTTASLSASVTAAMAAAVTVADEIKALLDTRVLVVTYNVTDATYISLLEDVASDGFYWGCESGEEVVQILAGLANSFCTIDEYYEEEIDPPDPEVPPVEGACNSSELNYFDFLNWDVLEGCVDLIGVGANGVPLYDLFPGNGLYLDMVGTRYIDYAGTIEHSAYPGTTTLGKIRSKTTFNFTAGKTYTLSLKFAGPLNVYGTGYLNYIVQISIDGGVLAAQSMTQASNSPLALREFTFTPTTDLSGRIVIQQTQAGAVSATDRNGGCFVDDISLDNDTDNVNMFSDDFDSENPCPV